MGLSLIDCGEARTTSIAAGIERIDGFFPPTFLALQTTREGGVSRAPYASFNLATHVGDDAAHVAANRARLAGHLPATPLWLTQVHGTAVADCSSGASPDADACVVDDLTSAAVVMTADCLPLLVARPAAGQCAAIHAGWKGLAAGVIEASLDRMASAHPSAGLAGPDDWYVWIGPAIGPQAFEVGEDVFRAFISQDPNAAAAFDPAEALSGEGARDPGHSVASHKWRADLAMLALRRIRHWSGSFRGAANLFLACSKACVHAEADRYFSYRRDRVTGRMASLICRLS